MSERQYTITHPVGPVSEHRPDTVSIEDGVVGDLFAALAQAQGEMSNAPFDATNPHFKSKYATLASIRDATIPHLAKHGLSIHQITKIKGDGLVLATRLGHSSGQWIESIYPLPNSNKPHEMGSAITYARRYSWAAITGIAAEEDEDGNAAQEGAKNGNALPSLPKRKSSAQAKRDGDWKTLEQALADAQSAREVERLREEWVRDWYPSWKDDWRNAADEEFDKRLATFSQGEDLKQTLKDSIEEDATPTPGQVTTFHDCARWLKGAETVNDLVRRATKNDGYTTGFKQLTPRQQADLRTVYAEKFSALRAVEAQAAQ